MGSLISDKFTTWQAECEARFQQLKANEEELNRIFIDISVLIKYGVSIEAVAESLKEAIKYKVENFTGMIVDTVNVNVAGLKL